MVNKSYINKDACVLGSEFVDKLKPTDRGYRYKTRLVAKNYGNNPAAFFAIKALAALRLTYRLIRLLTESIDDLSPYVRGIAPAYIQFPTPFERKVYIRHPKDINLSSSAVWKVVRRLREIPEPGINWYLTYLEHHIKTINMVHSRVDPCCLFQMKNNSLAAMLLWQIDVNVIGDKEFLTN